MLETIWFLDELSQNRKKTRKISAQIEMAWDISGGWML
jgi:hypothetical protein